MVKLSLPLIDRLIRESLKALLDDLRKCDWYVREHEIVNLFVFKHLVPALKRRKLNLTKISIECPVAQVACKGKERPGARKDLVIWAEPMTTVWKGCGTEYVEDLWVIQKKGSKPLAVLEWKNISLRSKPTQIKLAHEKDVEWLRRNLQGGMMKVGYAILVDQSKTKKPSLKWTRLTGTNLGQEPTKAGGLLA
ncbi:MAG: hypothetical protein LAO03_12460 [Acidobacteriia bacterium]|nr:hypothetical protein [Terriglobia bacterium]